MRQRIQRAVLFLLLLALVPCSLLLTGAGLPSYYQDSYYAEMAPMYRRLKDTEGPKIVVAGGSNVAFGLDSGLMESLLAEKGYSYTVCPFGLYAAVGTSAMLDLSLGTLRPGDIVLLSVEPTADTMSAYFGATAFWKCAEDAPELLLGVSREKQSALFGNYIPYLQERYAIRTSGILPQAEGVYARASFNGRCDLVYPREGNAMALGYDASAPVDLAGVSIDPAFAEQVNEYCEAAREAGAAVYLTFCPVNRSAMAGSPAEQEDAVRSFFQRCNATFLCPVLSNPFSYILDSGWFYDSNFHLNSAGAVCRTVSLTQDLLPMLGCYEALAYDLPEMPSPIADAPAAAEDTGLFTFEPVADQAGAVLGYQVSGLTAAGLAETSLAIPASYVGKPVAGILPGALDGAVQLEQLQIPESIERLPDRLFQNCSALSQIVLAHQNQPCSIAEHTLDGADQVRIFVPTETYSLYRDGYGCETNPWTPYLDRIYTF